MSGVPVVWKQRPFDGAPRMRTLDFRHRMPTVGEIVASIPVGELPRGFMERGEVRINGDRVPRGCWHLVRPRYVAGRDTVVSLHMPLRGGGGSSSGGGSSKNPLATVLSIAVLLVAAAVSGGALDVLGAGSLFASGTIGASVAGAAIAVGGSLLIAALVPPPAPASGSTATSIAGTSSAAAASLLTAASLSGNALSPGSSVPRVVGTMKLFPPLLCNPLIEVVGDTEVGEAVFGLAGPHKIAQVTVGGTDVTTMSGVNIQIVEGKEHDAIQTMVGRYSYTQSANADLIAYTLDQTTQYKLADQSNPASNLPQYQAFVSRKAPDEIWVTLQWGGGLINGADTSQTINQAFRLQFRLRGSDTWINAPEIHFSQNKVGTFEKVLRLKWGAMPAAKNPPSSDSAPVYAYKVVPGQDGSTIAPATGGWTADPYFSKGAGNDVLSAATFATSNVANTELYADKVIFYLDPAVFPQGIYEVQVLQSCAYKSASFAPATYKYGAAVFDFFSYYISSGVARIAQDPTSINSAVSVSRVSSVWNQNPVQSTDFATVSIKVTGRSLDQLAVLASGYVRDWDGDGWNTLTTTSNPAPHFRDVLAGSLGATPIDEESINNDELLQWRDDCSVLGYTCNAVIESNTYMDALSLIATSGYANVRHNEKWGVFQDKDVSQDAPAQIFTPRNMANFKWTRAFAKQPSGIRATFVNADDDYAIDEIIVYSDPSRQDANDLQQQTYYGLVTEDDVTTRAIFDLNNLQQRLTFYSGDTSMESLVCQRGSLVGVQHDILTKQAGFSRVKTVIKDGGNVTGLELDGSIPVATSLGVFSTPHLFTVPHVFDLGQKTGVAIRLKNGNGVMVKQVMAADDGDETTISFVTPFSDPGDMLDEDCLVAAGPLGEQYKRLIVFVVTPGADLGATLTFVDEAPDLWDRTLLVDGNQFTYLDVGDEVDDLLRAA